MTPKTGKIIGNKTNHGKYEYGRLNIPRGIMREMKWKVGDQINFEVCYGELILRKGERPE